MTEANPFAVQNAPEVPEPAPEKSPAELKEDEVQAELLAASDAHLVELGFKPAPE